MKSLALSLIILMASATAGWAKTITVTGAPARSVMEALYASGFEVKNIDEEWYGKTLSVKTKALSCRYSGVSAPDDWMSHVDCNTNGDEALKESLALGKAISPYADFEGAAGSRWLTVNAIQCSMIYNDKAYECKIDIVGNAE